METTGHPIAAAQRRRDSATKRTKAHLPEDFYRELSELRRGLSETMVSSRAEGYLAKQLRIEGNPGWELIRSLRELASSVTYRACPSKHWTAPDLMLHARLYDAGRLAGRDEQYERNRKQFLRESKRLDTK